MLTKLLFRTLPDYYPAGSAYAHFPFLVPATFRKKLAAKPDSIANKYIWTRPPVPKESIVVTGYQDVSQLLLDVKTFDSGYDDRIQDITRGVLLYKQVVSNPVFLCLTVNLLIIGTQIQKILFSEQNIRTWTYCFQSIAGRLIKQKSVAHVGSDFKYVDIVKDVVNLLPIYWLADEIVCLYL